LTVVLVAAGCGSDEQSSSNGDTLKVTVAGIPPFSITAWPLVIADSGGYFAEEGITVDKIFTFDGGQLLAGDQVNIINDGADSGLLAAQQGKDVIAFAPLAGHITDGLIVKDDIQSVADLAGTTLRTSGAGATDEFLLQKFLEANGVDPTSVEYLPVEDDGAALAQLSAGQIDGGLFDQGLLLEAEQGGIAGAAVLVRPAEFGVYPWNSLQTTRTFADEHGDKLPGFVRAIQRAIAFIQDAANKDKVVTAVLAADNTLDKEGVVDTYDAAKGFGLYTTAPLTPADIQPAVDFLSASEGQPITVDLTKFIENKYVTEAQAGT
jgi:NitT/TauT family transport system substrate-binding protein